jgi:hypothetical protein
LALSNQLGVTSGRTAHNMEVSSNDPVGNKETTAEGLGLTIRVLQYKKNDRRESLLGKLPGTLGAR